MQFSNPSISPNKPKIIGVFGPIYSNLQIYSPTWKAEENVLAVIFSNKI